MQLQVKVDELKSADNVSLTSLNVFKLASKAVCEIFAFLSPDERQEASAQTYCGAGFKRNDLLYHCSDCALDETCVMCEGCFVYEAHKDHNYWYTVCTEATGGSCDCGEADSWRNDLKCPKHKDSKELKVEADNNFLHSEGIASVKEALSFVSSCIKEYISVSKEPRRQGQHALVLYNDEFHSFGDVIAILQDELQIEEEVARDYATLVDQKGFAVIYYSSSVNVLERFSRKVSATSLTTSIESHSTCWNLIFCTEIMEALIPFLSDHSWLRALVVDWLLQTQPGDSVHMKGDISFEQKSNLQLLLIADHRLWKSFRVHFNDLLNLCNSINQETKKEIAGIFCENYRALYDAFLKEKREPELSIVRFSVQLFTLIPVAEHCVREHQILSSIFSKLVDILEPGCGQDGILAVAALRSLDYNKVNHLIHDALQIMRNLGDAMAEEVMQLSILEPFLYILYMLSHLDQHVRKTGDHVEFERDNVDSAQYICFEMQKVAVELCRLAVSCEEECHLIWTLLDKFTSQSKVFQLYAREEKLLVPLYKSRRGLSFFGSLSWFWGLLMQAASANGNLKAIYPPLKLMKLFAKDSLLRLLFSAEVRSNLWVRNGSIMTLQEYFYSGTVYHHLTYLPDVFNCIILASFMELDPFINFLLDHSALFAYFEEADQNVTIIEQLLVILISSISKNAPILDPDQILINLLGVDDQSRSALVRLLPDSIVDRSDFRNRVFQHATLKVSSNLGTDAVLEIKPESRARYDPFYWADRMDSRMKTWVSVSEKKRFSLKALLLSEAAQKRYQPSESAAVAYKTLSGILAHLLKVDSAKFEFALVATLFCVLMLPDDFFDERGAAAIEDAVSDLKKNRSSSSSLQALLSEFNELFLKKNLRNRPALPEKTTSTTPTSTKPTAAEKRAKILQQFKAKRSNFIAENAVVEDAAGEANESGFVCVVCSGSKGESDNGFVLPLQLNRSKLVAGFEGILLRGCCHVFHRKCFDGLRGGPLRKCPLCSAAIDEWVAISETELSFDAATLLSRINEVDLKATDLGTAQAAFDAQVTVIEGPDCSQLHAAYAYTLLYLSVQPPSASVSPQLISTLEAVKKALIASKYNFPRVTDRDCIVDDIRLVLSIVTKFHFSLISQDQAAALLKFLAYKYATCHLRLFNQVLQFILLGSVDEELFVFVDESTRPKEISPSTSPLASSLTPLIELPDRFDELLKGYLKRKCSTCRSVPRSPAICLVCGELVCLGEACCRSSAGGECRRHRTECSADTGLFLLLKNCALLLLSQSSGLILPAPYLNAFGEHDLDLRSESPLHLSRNLYGKVLAGLWSGGEVRDFILRNENHSRMTAASWHLL